MFGEAWDRFMGTTNNIDETTKKYVLFNQDQLNTLGNKNNPTAHSQHIFEADEEGKIERSCCDKFVMSRRAASNYNPLNAPDMRQEAASIGRSVCGTCVSTLYGKED